MNFFIAKRKLRTAPIKHVISTKKFILEISTQIWHKKMEKKKKFAEHTKKMHTEFSCSPISCSTNQIFAPSLEIRIHSVLFLITDDTRLKELPNISLCKCSSMSKYLRRFYRCPKSNSAKPMNEQTKKKLHSENIDSQTISTKIIKETTQNLNIYLCKWSKFCSTLSARLMYSTFEKWFNRRNRMIGFLNNGTSSILISIVNRFCVFVALFSHEFIAAICSMSLSHYLRFIFLFSRFAFYICAIITSAVDLTFKNC